MNEVDLVRALLPEHQGPTATATQKAQAKLSADISRSRRTLGRPWWARRNFPGRRRAAWAAAAGAAAILVVAPATPHGSNQPAVLLADHAVAATTTQPAIPDHQWLYQKVVAKNPDGTFHTGVSWIQAGTGVVAEQGADGAGFGSGYQIATQDFGRLPSEPQALIRYLAALAGSGQGDEGAFLMIEGTFVGDAPPPAVAVKLYRALGDIPGVTVNHDAVDVAGRHGVAFARGGQEIILSNGSYRFMGFVTDGAPGHPVLDGEAILQRVPVAGAFVLP